MKRFFGLVVLAVLLLSVHAMSAQSRTKIAPEPPAGMAVATFAGGCFWCMEPPFDRLDGVISTTSGYVGGKTVGPTYQEVSSGKTGHIEAVRIVFDPAKVSYEKLLDVFWRNVDPVDGGGQFCDRGEVYRPAIFVHDDAQRQLAQASLDALRASGRLAKPIAVTIERNAPFYVAEEYHQDYYVKNPLRYKYYRWNCGRDQRLEEVWGADARPAPKTH